MPKEPQPEPPLPSDVLEQSVDAVANKASQDGIILASLGCYPGTKRTFQHMGLGGAVLPFDWIRVSMDGLMTFIEKDFQDFFNFSTVHVVESMSLTVYRHQHHSFWHDTAGTQEFRDKVVKRIANFNGLAATSENILFVRVVATSEEILQSHKLLEALVNKFGEGKVGLLMIVDWQSAHTGAFVVDDLEDVMVYFLPGAAHETEAPYVEPIKHALDWLQGNELVASCVADLNSLHCLANPTFWGLTGPGGIDAFEAMPSASCKKSLSSVADAGVVAVSLGFSPQTAACIHQLGLHCEAGSMPFDFPRTKLDGLFHFLREGFEDFFTITSTTEVEGTSSTVRRSQYHCFWQDGRLDENSYKPSFDRFHRLREAQVLKLFVRVVASTEELREMGELHAVLREQFGERSMLLAIADFQASSKYYVIDGQEHLFLASFLPTDTHAKTNGYPYTDSISTALKWANGELQLQAVVVPSFEALAKASTHSNWGLRLGGPDGLPFFEDPETAQSILSKRSEPMLQVAPRRGCFAGLMRLVGK